MIYTQTIRIIRCDRCGLRKETNAANKYIAIESAEREGWLITDKGDWLRERHYCLDCRGYIATRPGWSTASNDPINYAE